MSRILTVPGAASQPGAITRWLTSVLRVPEHEIVGCTDDEIHEVEYLAGRPLPLAYMHMLREMGRAVGRGGEHDHFRRSMMLYPDVLKVPMIALETVRHSGGDPSLLARAFPFRNWEGVILLLDLSQPRDDPPVLYYDDERTPMTDWRFRCFSHSLACEIVLVADALAVQQKYQKEGSKGT